MSNPISRWMVVVAVAVFGTACSDGDPSTSSSVPTPPTGGLVLASTSPPPTSPPPTSPPPTSTGGSTAAGENAGTGTSTPQSTIIPTSTADGADATVTNAPIPTILPPPTTTIEPVDDTSTDTTPPPATFVSTRSASCDGTGTAPYDLRTVEIGATPTGAAIAIEYAPIEPRHAVAVTVVAGDDRHQVVAELFEDGTFVVRLQDLVASDSEFVGGTQVVDDQGMQIEVPVSALDTASLTGAKAVELVVDGVLVETCRLD